MLMENAAPTPEQIEATKRYRAKAKPYSGRYRYDDDEPEVAAPTSQDAPANGATAQPASRDEDENLSPEEVTYKKRYGDLRTLHQRERNELQRENETLKRKFSELQNTGSTMPKSEAEIKAWMGEYPDLAATILHLADNKVRESLSEVQDRLARVEEDSLEVLRDKAYLNLLRLHPDADDIRGSKEFHDWVANQEEEIQSWFYDNDTNHRLAAKGIDIFKAETGWGKPAKKKTDSRRDGSREVPESTTRQPTEPAVDRNSGKRVWRESEIIKLRPSEYEKLEADIMEAQIEGRVLYDLKHAKG